jgi:hypothetical protein
MTFEVDNEALKLAMARHYEEKLAKELREMFIYSGNEDTNRIWQLYLEEVQRKAEEEAELADIEAEHSALDKWVAIGFMLCLGAYIAYSLWVVWKSFTLTPT